MTIEEALQETPEPPPYKITLGPLDSTSQYLPKLPGYREMVATGVYWWGWR